jgi:predicted nucleic acid-binding protein
MMIPSKGKSVSPEPSLAVGQLRETEIVIDTGALLDILVRTRPRHKFAKLVGVHLIENGIRVKVPMHAMFELRVALMSAKTQAAESGEAVQFNEDIGESTPLKIDPVPIDAGFFQKYFQAEIPYLKAGDYPFVALAKVDGLILLTEDVNQYQAAEKIGVNVYTLAEFRETCIAKP